MRSLPRRTLLRGSVLGIPVGIGLPLLDGMLDGNGEALAAGEPLPRRFGTWFFGGGVVSNDQFFPDTTGKLQALKPMMAPLANVTEYLTLVRGVSAGHSMGNGHHLHRGYALSNSYHSTADKGYPGDPPAPSIDQIVAGQWKGSTRFDSLQLAVLANGVNSSISWKAGHQTLKADASPKSVFLRLFGVDPAEANPDAFAAIQAARRSMLDAAMGSVTRLSNRIGTSDRQRLAAHLDGLRDLERRLQSPSSPSPACPKSSLPTIEPPASRNRADLEGLHKAMADLLVIALSCDVTRVFSMMFTGAQDNTIYYQVGQAEGYHTLTHNKPWYYAEGHKVVTFIMKQLAYLTERLKATPDGPNANLLDNMLLYATTEMRDAYHHTDDDLPIILVGRAGGTLAGGTYVRGPEPADPSQPLQTGGLSIGSAMLAALRAVGIKVASVGDKIKCPEAFATTPMPGILAG